MWQMKEGESSPHNTYTIPSGRDGKNMPYRFRTLTRNTIILEY